MAERAVSLAEFFRPRLVVARAIFFAVVSPVRARGHRHHLRRLHRRERHHARRAGGAVHLRRHGSERFCVVRDRRRRKIRTVAHAPCSRRSSARLCRCAQTKPFALVALCRFVPGVVFIAFIACGWTRVPLGRFTAASLLVSALYLPLMLCIVVFFGDALDNRVGLWTWPFLLCVLVAIGFVRRRVFAFQEGSQLAASSHPTMAGARADRHRGRAPGNARRVSLAQRIPRGLFFLP